LVRALRERFDQHKRIARWTLPIWFYVSVTGVITTSCFTTGMRLRKPILLLMLAALVASIATLLRAENGQGTISGTVHLVGPPPGIPTVLPQTDFDMCGSVARPTQSCCWLKPSRSQCHRIPGGLRARISCNGTNDAIVLDQRDCEFVPRIQIARSGAPLILKNSDPILHVGAHRFDDRHQRATMLLKAATPYAGYEKIYQLANFREPMLLQVTSANGHEWMAAYIAVLPHPWAALTDENGRFTLRNIPAGTHRITCGTKHWAPWRVTCASTVKAAPRWISSSRRRIDCRMGAPSIRANTYIHQRLQR